MGNTLQHCCGWAIAIITAACWLGGASNIMRRSLKQYFRGRWISTKVAKQSVES